MTNKQALIRGTVVGFIIIVLLVLFTQCNGNPPNPEPCEISYFVTETEDGKVATVLKNNVEILRIEATNGIDGIDGQQGAQGIQGVSGVNGIDGKDGMDYSFPDTIYLKDLDTGISKWYALSTDLLPPEKPEVDTTYISDVIFEGNNWVYILRADSLKLHWIYGYKDVNGQPLDTADVYFHVAYLIDGVTHSLKPNPNVTQNLSLVMHGLPQGDIVPCVSAYILKENQRVYSTWTKSTGNGWYCRGDQ